MRKLSLSLVAAAAWAQAPELVKVEGGPCPIGGSETHKGVHKEKVSPYHIGKYVVTNEEYKRFVDATGHTAPERNVFESRYKLWDGRSYPAEIARQPVVNVSWIDAGEYCQWLSKTTGVKFRLPTEEEWELAARGGQKGKPYPWGEGIDKKKAWYGQKWKGLETLKPADYGGPNGFGLFGMAGNVWQWTADWYVPIFDGRPVQEELNLHRVLRGGSWANSEEFLGVGYRSFYAPNFRDLFVGFRVAADAE